MALLFIMAGGGPHKTMKVAVAIQSRDRKGAAVADPGMSVFNAVEAQLLPPIESTSISAIKLRKPPSLGTPLNIRENAA